MTDAHRHTHADLLRLAGRLLHGERWQEPLARDLGVSGRQVRYWDDGREPPDDLPDRLGALLGARAAEVAEAVEACEALGVRIGAVASARRAARGGRPGGGRDMDDRIAVGDAGAALLRDLFGGRAGTRVPTDATWADGAVLARMAAEGRVRSEGRPGASAIPIGDGTRLGRGCSLALLGRPGSGKGTAVVVPTMLAAEGLVAHDPKDGELLALTGRDRAARGRVVALDWGGDGGDGANLLAAPFLPPTGRRAYLAAVAAALVPPPRGDAFFADGARRALRGLLETVVGLGPVALRGLGMPEEWVGREPCLPMAADWILAANARAEPGDGRSADGFDLWLKEVEATVRGGGDSIDAEGLTSLLKAGTKERDGVIGTLHAALAPVRRAGRALEASTFAPADLRGVDDGEGGWRPFSLFLSTSVASPSRCGPLDAAVLAALAHHLAASAPGGVGLAGERLGPHDVTVVLDECSKAPFGGVALSLVGPGPSRGVAQIVVGQDAAQMERDGYGPFLAEAHARAFSVPDGPDLRAALPDFAGGRPATRPAAGRPAMVSVLRGWLRNPVLAAAEPYHDVPALAARVDSPRSRPSTGAPGATTSPGAAPATGAGRPCVREGLAALIALHGGRAVGEDLGFALGSDGGGARPGPASDGIVRLLVAHGGAAVSEAMTFLRDGGGGASAA